jgi:uncharacterized delta-60 repeat protein
MWVARLGRCVLFAAALMAGARPGAAALPGELDPSFNGGQPVELDLSRTTLRSTGLTGVVVDAGGNLVVTGSTLDEDGRSAVALARLDSSGGVDATFGSGGSQVVQLGLGGGPGFVPGCFANYVGARPAGGWLVTGLATTSDNRLGMLVAAFDAGGMLDFGFGSGGSVRPQPGGPAPATSFGNRGAIASDGSSFVAGGINLDPGAGGPQLLAVTKVTALGVIATGFGNMPTVGTYASGFDETGPAASSAAAPVVTPQGILVVGKSNDALGRPQLWLLRLSAGGMRDTTFAGGLGLVLVQAADPAAPTRDSSASAIAIGPDQEIYVAGVADDGDDRQAFAVTRFTPTGVLDGSFAAGGTRRIQTASGTGAISHADDVIVQPDGKVLLVGSSGAFPMTELVILRLETDGDLDPTFGASGIVRLQIESTTTGSKGALNPDGNSLVVVGVASTESVAYGLVARVLLTEVTTTTTTLPASCAAVPSIVGARCRLTLLASAVDGEVPEGKLRKRLARALARGDTRLAAAEGLEGRPLRRNLRKALAQIRRVRRLFGSKAAVRTLAEDRRAALTTETDALASELDTLLAALG